MALPNKSKSSWMLSDQEKDDCCPRAKIDSSLLPQWMPPTCQCWLWSRRVLLASYVGSIDPSDAITTTSNTRGSDSYTNSSSSSSSSNSSSRGSVRVTTKKSVVGVLIEYLHLKDSCYQNEPLAWSCSLPETICNVKDQYFLTQIYCLYPRDLVIPL